jgi:hypothetical protein
MKLNISLWLLEIKSRTLIISFIFPSVLNRTEGTSLDLLISEFTSGNLEVLALGVSLVSLRLSFIFTSGSLKSGSGSLFPGVNPLKPSPGTGIVKGVLL